MPSKKEPMPSKSKILLIERLKTRKGRPREGLVLVEGVRCVREALVADVQGWLDDPATNRGWIVIGVEGVRKTSKRLFSREHDDPAERPRLTIEIE